VAVVYRKGELSKAMIDREWPHQVVLPAYCCGGSNYVTMRLFCEAERLSLCVRGHSSRRNDTDFVVFCFAERPDAEQFQTRLGGEFIDPKDRPRGSAPDGNCEALRTSCRVILSDPRFATLASTISSKVGTRSVSAPLCGNPAALIRSAVSLEIIVAGPQPVHQRRRARPA
jgi:hypothetical protein